MACTLYRVQSCEAVIRNVIYNFLMRADECENSVIRAICNGSFVFVIKLVVCVCRMVIVITNP